MGVHIKFDALGVHFLSIFAVLSAVNTSVTIPRRLVESY